MIVYAVFKEAIYRHECCGVFSTIEAAKACAEAVLEHEDGHHEVAGYPFAIDTPGALIPAGESYEPACVEEPHEVFRVSKKVRR